jgi:outer membrane receptor for ferrienterochelin and colicin
MTRPLSLLGLTALLSTSSPAQQASSANTNQQEQPEIIVQGKAQDLIGQASSATVGQASAEELMARPFLRRSEVLETIPGLITTQHAGGGKAT